MTFLTELDVINDMLATLGETPLNQIDEDHPYVSAGLRMLRVTNMREQAKKWWFNTELITLHPDATSGSIYVPQDALSVDPVVPSNDFIHRGRRLYNPKTNSYAFTTSVDCKLVRLVEFADLPPSAASVVALSAVLDFQKFYDADKDKTALIIADLRTASYVLSAEHIRNSQVNLLNRPSTAFAAARLGFNPSLGGLLN